MAREQHRHDISDKAWEKIRPYTIGEKGTRGGNARDTRQFINGVFWILRTGAPWRDLPETYGNWKNVRRRFCRWRDKGIWEKILEALVDDRCQPCQSTSRRRWRTGWKSGDGSYKRGNGIATRYAKTPLLSLPLSKSAALLFGSLFIDDTI